MKREKKKKRRERERNRGRKLHAGGATEGTPEKTIGVTTASVAAGNRFLEKRNIRYEFFNSKDDDYGENCSYGGGKLW